MWLVQIGPWEQRAPEISEHGTVSTYALTQPMTASLGRVRCVVEAAGPGNTMRQRAWCCRQKAQASLPGGVETGAMVRHAHTRTWIHGLDTVWAAALRRRGSAAWPYRRHGDMGIGGRGIEWYSN